MNNFNGQFRMQEIQHIYMTLRLLETWIRGHYFTSPSQCRKQLSEASIFVIVLKTSGDSRIKNLKFWTKVET